MFDVVAIGELLIDFTENGISKQGNILLEANPGGAPCNVLSMLQKLGKKTAFIGKVGADALGGLLINTVKELGINTDNLIIDNEIPTTLAFVHNSPDGDRSFSFYRNPGADMMLRWDEINPKHISKTKIFHFGTLSLTDKNNEFATKNAILEAKKNNVIISFDPNLRPPLWKNIDDAKRQMWYGINQCDILKISDDEIKFLTDKDDIDEGITEIKQHTKARLICATMGKDGSKAYYDGKSYFVSSFIRNDTIDTTGAGDTFMACILNSVLDNGLDSLTGDNILKMLEFANAAASIITSRKGALKVMPERFEVLDFINTRKNS